MRKAPCKAVKSEGSASGLLLTLAVLIRMTGYNRVQPAPFPDSTLPQVRGGTFHFYSQPAQPVCLCSCRQCLTPPILGPVVKSFCGAR